MGQVTVYFIGICTHMQWPEDGVFGEVQGFRHRVVLVNGKAPRTINHKPIPRHRPMLRVESKDVIGGPVDITSYELDGATVQIANAIGELQYEESFQCCIPHLKALTPNLPPPSYRVVAGAHPERASAYFEVTSGVLTAGIVSRGAAVSVLTMTTLDESPLLRITGFRGEQAEFHLRNHANVVISNVAESEYDEDNDFLLHYETAEYVPEDAQVPTQSAPCCVQTEVPEFVRGRLNVGPGCSNSNFP